jgi:hypothetical protein
MSVVVADCLLRLGWSLCLGQGWKVFEIAIEGWQTPVRILGRVDWNCDVLAGDSEWLVLCGVFVGVEVDDGLTLCWFHPL